MAEDDNTTARPNFFAWADSVVDAESCECNGVQPCDYDTGPAGNSRPKCGRPSKFLWADETSGRDRPVCGIHGRSARIKMHDEVRPLTVPGSEGGE